MNFKEWWKKNYDDNADTAAFNSWNAAKEEIIKIIFLNSHQNGTFKTDIHKVLDEIEKI